MPKLYPDKQISVTKEAISLMLRSYRIAVFSYEVIDWGVENTSLYIQTQDTKYVLRVHRQGKKDEHISFQLAFQDYLRKHGIPVPRIYRNREGKELTIVEIDGLHWQVILMEYMEGENSIPHYAPDLIRNLAPIQAKMHLLGIEYAKKMQGNEKVWIELVDGLAEQIQDTYKHTPEITGFIERARSFRYELNAKLPHGWNQLDLDLEGNVLVKDDKASAILDFDDLDYSPCAVCLGYSLWAVLFADGKDMTLRYLAEYEKVRPLIQEEYEALPHIMLFRNYAIGIIELLSEPKPWFTQKILELEQEIPKISFL
ncbi:MAG: phosphotransferase [bacterium]|nr:phosphotransferase [bacterium]